LKILHLGGSGLFGLPTARRLAASESVAEICLAGRNQEALARAVAQIGDKARSVQLDARDADRVSSVAADFDLVVNTAGPEWEVLVPSLRGAIAAGVHYCDIGAFSGTVRDQLAMNGAAKEQDVVAILGIGFDPGLDNLLAAHASRNLDSVDEIQLRHRWLGPGFVSQSLDLYRKDGHVDTSLQGAFRVLNEPVSVYREREWTMVDALEAASEFVLPGSRSARAFPFGTSEAVTLPHYIAGVRSVSTVLIVEPPQLAELLARTALRMRAEGLTFLDAAKSFLRTVGEDPDRWLKTPEGVVPAPSWYTSASATGWKGGSRARLTYWPDGLPSSTVIPLTVAALRILRGEVSERGVLPPEGCFEPMSFFKEAATYAKEEDRAKPLLGESIEWID